LLIADSKAITGTLVTAELPVGAPPVFANTPPVPEGTTTPVPLRPRRISIMVAVFVLINHLLMLITVLTAVAVTETLLAVTMPVDATFILKYLPLLRSTTQALHLPKRISISMVVLTRLVV
jgi:hypothetical protein